MDGTVLLCGSCLHGDEVVDCAFDHFLTSCQSENFPDGHEKEELSSLQSLPNDDVDRRLCISDHNASGGLNIQDVA